jgi:hypothetical protein
MQGAYRQNGERKLLSAASFAVCDRTGSAIVCIHFGVKAFAWLDSSAGQENHGQEAKLKTRAIAEHGLGWTAQRKPGAAMIAEGMRRRKSTAGPARNGGNGNSQ